MARLPFLPIWVGDFMTGTQHLDCRESGALLLLLFAAWSSPSGGLPDDDRQLARMARCSTREWAGIRQVVMDFWHLGEDGLWHQKRLDEVRRTASDRVGVARAAANARWLKRKETGPAEAMPGRCAGIASQSHIHIQNQIDHERAAPRARQPDGAGAALPAHPLRLSGRDSIWKLRLLGHRPGGAWNAAYGPPPESADDNANLDAEQRRQWRRHWGLPGDWRPA